MPSLRTSLAFLISLWVSALSFLDTQRATHSVTSPDHSFISDDSLATGRQLALRHCSSCHLFPEPALLDKKTWVTGVLPNMAMRLGLRLPGQDTMTRLDPAEEKAFRPLNVYPNTPLLSMDDWQTLVRYYEQTAPAEPLPQQPHAPVDPQLSLFSVRDVTPGNAPAPQTTLLKFDPNTAQLYVGDARNTLYVLDGRLLPGRASLNDTWLLDSPPTDIDFPRNAPPRLLTVGALKPSDQKLGRLTTLERNAKPGSIPVDIRNLPRPVHFAVADLNADGRDDLIICGFGNNAGKLFWYDGFDPTKEHILLDQPGARTLEVADFNHDQKPDLLVLMGQAREEIVIFYNLGNGRFREKTVLRFPPVFGSIYAELADFNKDGFPDILLTNGDNWDYSAILKNYHGIRIFLNDGKDNFRESWFYPLYGASKAVARDFDRDGDLDIAATSFYADLTKPEQGFLYFANQGLSSRGPSSRGPSSRGPSSRGPSSRGRADLNALTFKPFSTPEAANGKWLTMEAADFDQDGDTDIVLGSYFHSVGEMTPLLFRGITSFPQLLVLENRTKNR